VDEPRQTGQSCDEHPEPAHRRQALNLVVPLTARDLQLGRCIKRDNPAVNHEGTIDDGSLARQRLTQMRDF
jgi:hypothetical protein